MPAARRNNRSKRDTAMTGGDSIASPKIWQDKAGFEAAIAKFDADVKLAMAKAGDADGFKAGMAEGGKNCQSCHTDFRLRRD